MVVLTSKDVVDQFEKYVQGRGFLRLGSENKRLLSQFAEWLQTSHAPETNERCMHGAVVCEKCASMAVRKATPPMETHARLVREIRERHDRVSKLLWGPGAQPGMMLGPMDADAAHADRGRLLSLLTPEQRGEMKAPVRPTSADVITRICPGCQTVHSGPLCPTEPKANALQPIPVAEEDISHWWKCPNCHARNDPVTYPVSCPCCATVRPTENGSEQA